MTQVRTFGPFRPINLKWSGQESEHGNNGKRKATISIMGILQVVGTVKYEHLTSFNICGE